MRRLVTSLLALAACQMPPPQEAAVDSSSVQDGGAPDLSSYAALHITVTDEQTGVAVPARVLIDALPGTDPVSFNHGSATGENLAPGVVGAPDGVLLATGDGTVPIPEGGYRILVTHGPEWETTQAFAHVAARATQAISIPVLHSVDTHGWLAADLHEHTGRSFDSRLAPEHRVISEVAAGVSVITVTDHNVWTNVQPLIESLGCGQLAKGIVGDEFNFLEGHGGAYPMPYEESDPWGGVVRWRADYASVNMVSGEAIFDWLHQLPTRPVVTINHPRMYPDLGYFINLKRFGRDGWSPPTPLPTAGTFDGLEVMNGYLDDPADILAVVRDWFFLLSSGYRVAATGGSDSHNLNAQAGYPRTWIRFPSSSPADVTGEALADAIRGGRTIASNGPFAWLNVNGKEIGDLASTGGGDVVIEAAVDAADWVHLDRVQIFVNGALLREVAVARGEHPLWHDSWTQAVPPGDGWVVLIGRGSIPLPSVIIGNHGSATGAPTLPMVITSPVFLDGDGDGEWHPRVANPDPGPLDPSPIPGSVIGGLEFPRLSTAPDQAGN